MFIVWALIWLTIGAVTPYILIREEGQLTVGDLGILIFLIFLGPVGLLLFGLAYLDDYKDKVIWRKKNDD